jgi:hypothetical protein
MGEDKMDTRNDKRIVYGASCTWWGSIEDAGSMTTSRGMQLPCCPHCEKPLFEIGSEEMFIAAATTYEKQCHPGYLDMLNWARGKCFPSIQALKANYYNKKAN